MSDAGRLSHMSAKFEVFNIESNRNISFTRMSVSVRTEELAGDLIERREDSSMGQTFLLLSVILP